MFLLIFLILNKMKKLFLLSLVSTFSVGMFAQTGARYSVARAIYKDPSILESPVFWGIVGFIIVCVIIYGVCKDRDK